MTTLLPQGRPLTQADLEALPDDGHRYELVDGSLIVTPSPVPRHQRLVVGLYQEAGCPSYWVVDPDGPRLTAWELADGRYVEVANVIGEEPFEATRPFPVRILPSDLLR